MALLKNSLTRTRIKVSAAIENFKSYYQTYEEYDPMITQPQPSNPWITDDQTFWQFNSPLLVSRLCSNVNFSRKYAYIYMSILQKSNNKKFLQFHFYRAQSGNSYGKTC